MNMAEEDTAVYNSPPAWSGPSSSTHDLDDQKGVDRLRVAERELYERTRYKVMFSFIFGALSMMFLGFLAETGGKSISFKTMLDKASKQGLSTQTIDLKIKTYYYLDSSMLNLLYGGWGFAAFCHFCAFALSVAAACIVSPYLTGTVKERLALKGPITFESEIKKRRPSTFSAIGIN
jgi:hypothetical protein